ncbi:MAG TPA: hypothetical protein VIC26_08730 [Marinagarivorans sp.]
MLKKIVFALILPSLPLSACAASNDINLPDCSYSQKVVSSIAPVENAKVISEIESRDPDSFEKVSTHIVEFSNGDIARIEQKYCLMYNFEVSYQLKKNSPNGFITALNRIELLINKTQQDYRLKAPLSKIVDRMMNENNESTESPFEHTLPVKAASSDQYFQHFISYRLTPKSNNEAIITFQYSIGGA